MTIQVIKKNASAQIQVERKHFKGKDMVDVRIWYVPKESAELKPSMKGVSFDHSKLEDVIAALQSCRNQ